MQCTACQHENPGAARFCNECGARLGEASRARSVGDYTPRHLAEKILRTRAAIEGERKRVTVLFSDIKGSMDLTEGIDPEEWHGIMERFLGILTEGVHRFEGTVNQYTGDGIMALFGAPIAHEDHAQRACYAALHLRDALRRYADELRMDRGLSFAVRIGLNSGEVVVGRIGDDLRMDYTAHGHTVGLAARMEQLAEPGTAFLTEATGRLVEGYFELRDLGRTRVKGNQEPVGVYELLAPGGLRSRLDLARQRGLTDFVGRGDEMQRLEDALERAGRGEGQVVCVVGEPGVGKSRLCFEFLERCRARGIRTAEASAFSHTQSVPLQPVLGMLRSNLGIGERDDPETVRNKIAGQLARRMPGHLDAIPVFNEYLGVPEPGAPATSLDPETRQSILLETIVSGMRARGAHELTAQLFEDFHWMDGASESFAQRYLAAIGPTSSLVLVNFRPEYELPPLGIEVERIDLEPLGAEGTAQLVSSLLGADSSLEDLRGRIAERAGGNPFFAEEIVRTLHESGVLDGEPGGFRLGRPLDEPAIPETVETVLAARIDRLPEAQKEVLQAAAVLGRTFTASLLAGVIDRGEGERSAALDGLERAGFVHQESLYPEIEYAFEHPLSQEVAYRSQLSGRRARAHRDAALQLEQLYADRLEEKAALLAHHWEGAGEEAEAARWHRRAAEWAALGSREEALRHWRSVRALSRADDALRLEACGQVLRLGQHTGLPEAEVDEVLAEGRALAEAADDHRALALLMHSVSRRKSESIPVWRELAVEAAEQAARSGDRHLALYLEVDIANADMNLGRLADALARVERCLREAAEDPELSRGLAGAQIYAMHAWFRAAILMLSGRLHEAREQFDELVRVAREHGNRELLRNALSGRTELGRSSGDAESAMADAVEAREIAEALGTPFQLAWAEHMLGLAHYLQGNGDDALRCFERSLAIWRRIGTNPHNETTLIWETAEAQLLRGDSTQAIRLARTALERSQRESARIREIGALRTLCEALLAERGAEAAEEARELIERCRALVERSGMKAYAPLVHHGAASLADVLGDEAGRDRELREARRLAAEIGAHDPAYRLHAIRSHAE